MRVLRALLLILGVVGLHASQEPQGRSCVRACTYEYNPVCGFNGKCYRFFDTNCFMQNYNCEHFDSFKPVETSKCGQCCSF